MYSKRHNTYQMCLSLTLTMSLFLSSSGALLRRSCVMYGTSKPSCWILVASCSSVEILGSQLTYSSSVSGRRTTSVHRSDFWMSFICKNSKVDILQILTPGEVLLSTYWLNIISQETKYLHSVSSRHHNMPTHIAPVFFQYDYISLLPPFPLAFSIALGGPWRTSLVLQDGGKDCEPTESFL